MPRLEPRPPGPGSDLYNLVAATAAWILFVPFYFRFIPNFASSRANFVRPFILASRRMHRGDVLGGYAQFWSSWNIMVTAPVTRPLYRLLGGDRRPVFAALVTFLFSGFFLHSLALYLWIPPLIMGYWQYFLFQPTLFLIFGLPVAWHKHRRRKARLRSTPSFVPETVT